MMKMYIIKRGSTGIMLFNQIIEMLMRMATSKLLGMIFSNKIIC